MAEEGTLGKLIGKTVCATLALLLAVFLFLYGICSLFFPSLMMTVSDSLGLEKTNATYSIRLYEKTGELSDLASAIERCYFVGKYQEVVKYGTILLADDGYEEFCEEQDETYTSAYYENYDAFITALIASAADAVGG